MTLPPTQTARYILLFCGAVLAGWASRTFLPAHTTQPHVAHCLTSPTPDANALALADPIRSRVMIADALVDADAACLSRIADVFLENGEMDDRAWSVLFSCWMKLNPREAWDFANRHPETSKIGLPLIALEQWAAVDPMEARKMVEAPDARQYKALIRGMLKSDVERAFKLRDEALAAGIKIEDDLFQSASNIWFDEEQFIRLAGVNPSYAVTLAERSRDNSMLEAVFLGLIDRSPEDARKWLDQRKEGAKILAGSARLMSNIAARYRPETMDLFMSWLPPGNERSEFVQEALESLAYGNIDLALKEAARLLPDPADRAEALGKIASIVAKTNFAKAWDILSPVERTDLGIRRVEIPSIEILDHENVREETGPFGYQWSLISMRGLTPPAEVKSQLLAGWIEVDKGHALRLMEKLTAEEVAQVVGDCIGIWVSRDPVEAVAWLARKLENQGDTDEVASWLREMDLHGENPRNMVATMPNGTVRMALSIVVVDELIRSDPARALEFARKSASANELVDSAYQSWVYRDPKAALEHLVPDEDAPASAWKNVVKKTFVKFPDETVRAVESLPPGPTRDLAVLALVQKSAFVCEPLRVTGWALSINNADFRRKALEFVFTRIGLDLRVAGNRETANAMRALVTQSEDIPENEKARLLERISHEFTQP